MSSGTSCTNVQRMRAGIDLRHGAWQMQLSMQSANRIDTPKRIFRRDFAIFLALRAEAGKEH